MVEDGRRRAVPLRLTARGRWVAAVIAVGLTGLALVLATATSGSPHAASSSPRPVAPTSATPTAPTPSAVAPTPSDVVDDPDVPTPTAPAQTTSPLVVNGRPQPPLVQPPAAGTGELQVVPGSTPEVSGQQVWTYRVEIEGGLPFDGAEVAAAVHATLTDPRGWGTSGNVFRRVDGAASMRIVLASPALTDRLCAPLQTRGQVSCRNGDVVVLNALRWGTGIADYAGDLASYREYLVNHEVGHRLGRSHPPDGQGCAGAGAPAKVMMQQTYGLLGCAPNAWPLAGE